MLRSAHKFPETRLGPKSKNMTQNDVLAIVTDEELEARIRPLVNEILERFNEEEISPSEAGMVILSLTYRLMEILKEASEARRFFILTLINLINTYLAEEMEGPAEATGCFRDLALEESS